MQAIALERGHLHGYPVPIDGLTIRVANGFPYPGMEGINRSDEPKSDGAIVNSFWSLRLNRQIGILRGPGGDLIPIGGLMGHSTRLDYAINSARAAMHFDLDVELAALAKLAELIPKHAWESYFIGGAFIETSKRSQVHYVFRKLRPTIALSSRNGKMRCLACLCLHPLAYYEDSYCGAMTPTDDVIAHLMMMRSDEHLFWKRSNQHPFWIPQAGV